MISIYLNVDTLDIVCRWFEEGRGGIAIEYDYNMVDCDVVDEEWASDCLDDLYGLKDEWGAELGCKSNQFGIGWTLSVVYFKNSKNMNNTNETIDIQDLLIACYPVPFVAEDYKINVYLYNKENHEALFFHLS